MKMKKALSIILVTAFGLAALLVVLNIPVNIKRGVNFQVTCVRLPLYLKILDFMDRHYNYKLLLNDIIDADDNPHDRVMKIFNWTGENIRQQPQSLPVVDDHAWYIIIRGYGTNDQSNDVFTTLCNYAGIDAFFDFIYSKDKGNVLPLSFAKLNNSWSVFDSYNGVYFINKKGGLACLEDIKKKDWTVFNNTEIIKHNFDYIKYLENLPSIRDIGLKRANIQSPRRRLIFQLRKWKVLR